MGQRLIRDSGTTVRLWYSGEENPLRDAVPLHETSHEAIRSRMILRTNLPGS